MKRFRIDEDMRFGLGLILLALCFIGSVVRAAWIMTDDHDYCRGYYRGYDQGYWSGYNCAQERATWPRIKEKE